MAAVLAVVMVAVAVMPVAAIAAVMTVATPAATVALVAIREVAGLAAATVVVSVRLNGHRVLTLRHQRLMHHVHLIVRRQIVRVMAKIAPLQRSIVTRHRVVISQIVVSALTPRVMIAHRRASALIALPLLIVATVVVMVITPTVALVTTPIVALAAAQVTVIHVQPGAALTAPLLVTAMVPQRVATMLTLLRLRAVSLRLVSSAVIARLMTICRFNAHRAWMPRRVVRVQSFRMTIVPSAAVTSQPGPP